SAHRWSCRYAIDPPEIRRSAKDSFERRPRQSRSTSASPCRPGCAYTWSRRRLSCCVSCFRWMCRGSRRRPSRRRPAAWTPRCEAEGLGDVVLEDLEVENYVNRRAEKDGGFAPVFVLAPARSHSSVAVAMLSQHPAMYGFPELRLFRARDVAGLLKDRGSL